MSQTKKTLYNTRLYNWDNSSDYIISIIKQLHIYGPGLKLGVELEEHFQRVVREAQGDSMLVVFSGDTPVGAVTLYPILKEDSHYPGKVMLSWFLVVEPGHPAAVSTLVRNMRRIAKENGADWLITSRAINNTTYIQKGWKL